MIEWTETKACTELRCKDRHKRPLVDLKILHYFDSFIWLPLRHRITQKIPLLTFKYLNNSYSLYANDIVSLYRSRLVSSPT